MSVDVAIARIRAYAHQKRWSKSRLAIEAGMTDTVLRRFDHRDWNPTVGTLRRLETLIPPEFEPYEQTSRQFIDFIEAKLTMHGVAKVVPDAGIIEAHARHLIEQRLAREALGEIRDRITRQAAATALPVGIEVQLRRYLARHPALAWDDALAQIISGQNGRDVVG
jgi:hypothetical protein